MDLNWGFVDVRDVAKAHILAMETDAASGRYLCADKAMHMRELVALLKSSDFNTYALPRIDLSGTAGSLLMKALSFTQPKNTGTYIRTNIGRTLRFDNSKIINELGLSFMPLRESMIETVNDLEKWGHLLPSKQ